MSGSLLREGVERAPIGILRVFGKIPTIEKFGESGDNRIVSAAMAVTAAMILARMVTSPMTVFPAA
jgi:hypothetical protein